MRSINTSSHASTLICFAADNASDVCETLASFASRNSVEMAEILLANHRVIGINIMANITPPMKAKPICEYRRYNVAKS